MLFGTEQQAPSKEDMGIIDPSVLEDILNGGKLPNIPTQTEPVTPTTPKPTEPLSTEPGHTEPTILPTAPTVPTEPPVVTRDQVMSIDFDTLIARSEAEGNDTLTTLHRYFAAQTPTKTNDFTGLFADKNLIYLVCESFSPIVISQELTPTLYKLSTEGIVVNNFYGSFRSVTTNGEYTACMELFPDMSRNKKDGSFAASIDNYLPFTLGNIFTEQKGVPSFGYHNYKGTYYRRNETHPNMGYTCKFMNDGMKFTYGWPSSDYEMMQQSVSDYVNQERFHAYYMTFSGHYMYDYKENPMCRINRDAVSHLTYSEPVCAYIACHLELEKAMTYLMEQLEMAGQLEDTVIVMTSDHYPYGLTEKQYSELAGEKKSSNFGIYENAFICWSYGMEDAVQVDTPCCTADILPTLLNLFGFQYDSRLLSGRDVLDPGARHIAILHNGSFVTEYVRFDSKTGKTTYLVDKEQLPEGYVDLLVKIVQNEFTISKAILDQDYYRIVLGTEDS
jgi:phosphoglycerol transferase MdoB-like AlkP superfamily enzyme